MITPGAQTNAINQARGCQPDSVFFECALAVPFFGVLSFFPDLFLAFCLLTGRFLLCSMNCERATAINNDVDKTFGKTARNG